MKTRSDKEKPADKPFDFTAMNEMQTEVKPIHIVVIGFTVMFLSFGLHLLLDVHLSLAYILVGVLAVGGWLLLKR
jgi:hypothetical protein